MPRCGRQRTAPGETGIAVQTLNPDREAVEMPGQPITTGIPSGSISISTNGTEGINHNYCLRPPFFLLSFFPSSTPGGSPLKREASFHPCKPTPLRGAA